MTNMELCSTDTTLIRSLVHCESLLAEDRDSYVSVVFMFDVNQELGRIVVKG